MPAPMRRPHGQVRQSQVLTVYGPGALVDLPNDSGIVGGLDGWLDVRDEIHEPRLQEKLAGVLDVPAVRLFEPPSDRDDPAAPMSGIKVWRFPRWYLSQRVREAGALRSRILVPWSRLTRGRYVDDDKQKHDVLPIRFVRACPSGHIGDIDWPTFVHGARTTCMRQLWLEERGTTGDLGELRLRCDCGRDRRMSDATLIEANPLGSCDGGRPWLGPFAAEGCSERNRMLLRHASNAYFAQTMSVISLPDPRERLMAAIDRVWKSFLEYVETIDDLRHERQKKDPVRQALEGLGDEEVLAEIQARRRGDVREPKPVKQAELEVLSAPVERIGEDRAETGFFAEALPREKWAMPLLGAVDRVLLVHRLREVTAQVGFTRFESTAPDVDGELEMGVKRAALAREADWLPAVENRGEGLFLGFRPKAIAEWLLRPAVVARGQRLAAGFDCWKKAHKGSEREFFGLPYVMLHSLAHLLITEVALSCGYPASSIRERVYAGTGGFGILLFTASPDAEGTLGGLVEIGRDVGRHVTAALDDRGRLCSNDPVCAQHDPASTHEQRHLLGAACHGCLLIAEPSCEQRNDFLDRALVVPTVDEAGAAFFAIED